MGERIMSIKLNIYINKIERYLQGSHLCFTCFPSDGEFVWIDHDPDYVFVTEVEIDDSFIDRAALTRSATSVLDNAIKQTQAKAESDINHLKERKQKMLSLPPAKGKK